MKKYLLVIIVLVACLHTNAQTWVDTLYQINTVSDISYGTSIDFAGNERDLLLDVSYPTNDTVPACGRPLLVAIHGGAFIAGTKMDGEIVRLREDFAKRGFTTAAINYRLGQFPTNLQVHCNTQLLGLEWDCLNMTDSSEWYRAYYRGIQDANGAIRWLVNHADDYDIDPNNIFLVGTSAGGFIAMGTAFIDDANEVMSSLTASMDDVLPPNSIYEAPCVQGYGYDTTIASMDLSRPALGSFEGTLNYPASSPYKVRGVGNFFGGAFNNIFGTQSGTPPALYMFHQPNDLIVPYNTNKVLAGFAACATGFPLNCAFIINRPQTMGSNAIASLLVTMQNQSQTIPDYLFEHTSNTTDCLGQVGNPSLGGHQMDNYWLRTTNMAAFFAPKIETCQTIGLDEKDRRGFKVYPNPIIDNVITLEGGLTKGEIIRFVDVYGREVYSQQLTGNYKKMMIELIPEVFKDGVYFVSVGEETRKVIVCR